MSFRVFKAYARQNYNLKGIWSHHAKRDISHTISLIRIILGLHHIWNLKLCFRGNMELCSEDRTLRAISLKSLVMVFRADEI